MDDEGGSQTPTVQMPGAFPASLNNERQERSECPNPYISSVLTDSDNFQVSRHLIQLLAQRGFRLRYDDDDEEPISSRRRGTRKSQKKTYNLPAVPSREGRKLMDAGVFGTSRCYRDTLRRTNPRLAEKLAYRELGLSRQDLVKSASSVAQVSSQATKPTCSTLMYTLALGPYTILEGRPNHPLPC